MVRIDLAQNIPIDSKSNDKLPKREGALKPRIGHFQKNGNVTTIDHLPIDSRGGEKQRD